MPDAEVMPNPYVGPNSFEERYALNFCGRDKEARELLAIAASLLPLFAATVIIALQLSN